MLRLGLIVVAVGVFAGCTERVNVCNSDSDCNDPAYPFCDVKGEYAESGMTPMSCSITPASCPLERCGCTPGKVTCEGETRSTCNADGKDVTTETCTLGCASDGLSCQVFDPSNGLLNQLLASAESPDVMLASATIDTTTGVVKDGGVPVNVESVTVAQTSGPSIRVLLAHSWTLYNVRVTGSMPLALVSVGQIALHGNLDASATLAVAGPGALDLGVCVGQATIDGGGGGGNVTAGGTSSQRIPTTGQPPPPPAAAGGSAVPGLSPFVGGCAGGAPRDANGTFLAAPAPGGGAIQLSSMTRIDIPLAAQINLGGGGGSASPGGGGSAGNLILEAPEMLIRGGLFLNGGSGAACGLPGNNGPRDVAQAAAQSCVTQVGPVMLTTHSGKGGAGTLAPGSGGGSAGGPAGGGGAAGKARIATRSGSADIAGARISAALEQATLNVH